MARMRILIILGLLSAAGVNSLRAQTLEKMLADICPGATRTEEVALDKAAAEGLVRQLERVGAAIDYGQKANGLGQKLSLSDGESLQAIGILLRILHFDAKVYSGELSKNIGRRGTRIKMEFLDHVSPDKALGLLTGDALNTKLGLPKNDSKNTAACLSKFLDGHFNASDYLSDLFVSAVVSKLGVSPDEQAAMKMLRDGNEVQIIRLAESAAKVSPGIRADMEDAETGRFLLRAAGEATKEFPALHARIGQIQSAMKFQSLVGVRFIPLN